MTRPRLGIIIASTRPGRVGLPVGEWVHHRAVEHGGFEAELLDLAEIALPFFDEPKHPRLGQYLHDHTKAWSATVAAQDAFVIVTPEYNHGFNAPLKNAIDYLWAEWQHKPVGFVAYGGVAAGTRAIQMLKPVLAVLKMIPMVESVPIPFVGQLVDADGQLQATDALDRAAATMLDELVRWEAALRPLRG
ncbi:MAG: NAD(P)H-dependent oxidoreductase [Chloroflexota bacterium]